MIRAVLACSMLLAALAAAEPPAPQKLQEIPLSDSAASPSGEPREHRFWRDQPGREGPELEVKIERLWSEDASTFASLRVKNTSPWELDEIGVRCAAVALSGRELGEQTETLRASDAEPLVPGFERRLKLTLDSTGAQVGEVSCSARGY